MRLVCVGICWGMVCISPAVPARGDKRDIQADVQAIYDAIARAFEKKDLDGVTKFSLPDATVAYADDKEVTLKEWKERAGKAWANIKQTKSRFQVENASRKDDAAVATYAETHDMVILDAKSGKEHKVHYVGTWRVTLKRTVDGWRLSRSVELERRVTRDGVLIDQWPRTKAK